MYIHANSEWLTIIPVYSQGKSMKRKKHPLTKLTSVCLSQCVPWSGGMLWKTSGTQLWICVHSSVTISYAKLQHVYMKESQRDRILWYIFHLQHTWMIYVLSSARAPRCSKQFDKYKQNMWKSGPLGNQSCSDGSWGNRRISKCWSETTQMISHKSCSGKFNIQQFHMGTEK